MQVLLPCKGLKVWFLHSVEYNIITNLMWAFVEIKDDLRDITAQLNGWY